MKTLVIAYGNPLRCDDAVAWQAAEQLKQKLPLSVSVVCVHQLMPELAEQASRAETVIFLDAARNQPPGKVTCHALTPGCAPPGISHFLAPEEVLALCNSLYERNPSGFLVSLGGECFEHGEELSSPVANALPELVSRVDAIVRQVHQDALSALS